MKLGEGMFIFSSVDFCIEIGSINVVWISVSGKCYIMWIFGCFYVGFMMWDDFWV